MVIFGIIFVVAALVVATGSGVCAARAAVGQRIPVWTGNGAYRPPTVSVLLQSVAAVLAGVGALLCFGDWGFPAISLMVVTFVPPIGVASFHNRNVGFANS